MRQLQPEVNSRKKKKKKNPPRLSNWDADRGQGGAGFPYQIHYILVFWDTSLPSHFQHVLVGTHSPFYLRRKLHTQAFFRDTEGSVPDSGNEANIAINQVT